MATYLANDFEFNFYNSEFNSPRPRQRSTVLCHPWTFEQRTTNLINDINVIRRDRSVIPPWPSRRGTEILPTWISREVEQDVYQAVNIIEEMLQYHKANFMATQDICALMWMQVLEEAIPILKGRILEAAALESLRDVIMTDAPPLNDTDEDDDWLMDL